MFKAVLEGKLTPYFYAQQIMSGGTLVKMDASGNVVPVAAAGDANFYGFLAQDVVADNVDNFKLTSVTLQARVGDKVGVYFGEGVYTTDQYSGNVAVGNLLYVGANAQLSLTASGTAVAIAETSGNSANSQTIRIRVL